MSDRQLKKRAGPSLDIEKEKSYVHHADLVLKHHNTLQRSPTFVRTNSLSMKSPTLSLRSPTITIAANHILHEQDDEIASPISKDDEEEEPDASADIEVPEALQNHPLVKHLLQLTCELESQSRRLLLEALPARSEARVILQADAVRCLVLVFSWS